MTLETCMVSNEENVDTKGSLVENCCASGRTDTRTRVRPSLVENCCASDGMNRIPTRPINQNVLNSQTLWRIYISSVHVTAQLSLTFSFTIFIRWSGCSTIACILPGTLRCCLWDITKNYATQKWEKAGSIKRCLLFYVQILISCQSIEVNYKISPASLVYCTLATTYRNKFFFKTCQTKIQWLSLTFP